ncbi:MAG: hypothetical protein JXQ30_06605 [Spirochaetes bacterium]|nr:hypothetical protein [Spirochaetota bacterium]
MDGNDKKKVVEFVQYLISNPNLKAETPVIREGMIITFITSNLRQLKKTLGSKRFFPHLSPDRVISEILLVLKQMSLGYLMPRIEVWLKNEIDYAVLEELFPLRGAQAGLGQNRYRSMLQEYLTLVLAYSEVRYNFNSVVNIFTYRALDRYLREVFHRRRFIFNEIRRVERLDLDCDEYIEYAKILFLIKNSVFMRVMLSSGSGKRKANINEAQQLSMSMPEFVMKLARSIKEGLPFLSEKAVVTAIKSNFRERQTGMKEASARLFHIIGSRYQDYKHHGRIDRAAESLDKSWFNIARSNSRFYGFNEKMVNELYLIAGDNMW